NLWGLVWSSGCLLANWFGLKYPENDWLKINQSLHTREVTGSSPVPPTTFILLPAIHSLLTTSEMLIIS
ncbi:MAG TPA: hypothetical protein PLL06_12360, partial [Acidobacteriota bacterium]|nr:hypothetical protein [Acidobacteriota bacterium]